MIGNANRCVCGFVIFAFVFGSAAWATSYDTFLKGKIQGAWVQYKDADEVIIAPGYGECNGKYWKITSPDTINLSGPLGSSENFIYIYVMDTSAFPDAVILGDTTEPTYRDTLLGWYQGINRCIGAVWCPGGDTLWPFGQSKNMLFGKGDKVIKKVLEDGSPNSANQFLEATAYTPVNAIGIHVYVYTQDPGYGCNAFVWVYESYRQTMGASGYSYTKNYQWLEMQRGWSRDLTWWGEDDDDNLVDVYIDGYAIDR